MRLHIVLLAALGVMLIAASVSAAGQIIGHAFDQFDDGLYEMEITLCRSGASTNAAWGRFHTSGYYELNDLTPGEYSLGVADLFYFRPKLFSLVPVRNGQVTPGDFRLRSGYFVRGRDMSDGPSCREARQTFVATGNVVKVTVWPRGNVRLYCSIHDAETDKQIGVARDTPSQAGVAFTWAHGEVPTVKGQRYYLKLRQPDGEPFSLYVASGKAGRAYPLGQAYYDGVAKPDDDIFSVIEFDDDGLITMCQWQPTDGKGQGGTEVGQTFKAIGPYINMVTIFATAVEGQYAETRFSIHEDGPTGKQIGPAKTSRLWNYRPMGQVFSVTWQPGEVPVQPGKTYYLKAVTETPGFYAFTNKQNGYPHGQAYFNGVPADPSEDLCISILGEAELYSSLSRIEGVVKDSSGRGVPRAGISLSPWGYAATTNARGEFKLPAFTAGHYYATCTARGYTPVTLEINADPGASSTLNFVLRRTTEQ